MTRLKKYFSLWQLILLPLLVLLFPLHVLSHSSSKADSLQRAQESYILKLDTFINIKFNVNNEYEKFKQEGDGFLYDIRPNLSLTNRISLSYRFISFGFGFKPKFIPGNNDNEEQGKTKAFSLGFNINGKHFLQELQVFRLKGFYLNNTNDFVPGWTEGEDSYLQLPDMKFFELRGSTGYKFNPNFSVGSLTSQTEVQLRSCGSLIGSLSYAYYLLDNKSNSATQTSSQKSDNIQLVASLGYFYNLVISKKWYAAAGIFPGAGFINTHLTTRYPIGNEHNKYTDPVFRIQERLGVGYNSKRLFAGSELSFTQLVQNVNHTQVQTQATRVYFQVFVGYRFKAPKFIKQQTDAVKNLAPKPIRNIID